MDNSSQPARPGKNMFVAYALWLLGGNLGLHRFYLGKKDSGVGYFVLTAVLTVFALTFGDISIVFGYGPNGLNFHVPIALLVFSGFIRLFWLFDLFYAAMLVRAHNDGEYVPPLEDLWQPFIDLVHAPRALWGINLSYTLEGWVYFGMLGYLAMHFSDFVFQGIPDADVHSHHMVGILTAGITLSMFFFGSVADRKGVRKTLIMAFLCLLAGRLIWSSAANVFPETGLRSGMHMMTTVGILLVILGYGMYQPAAYAGVRKFSSPKTASMNFAMLYALMNLGGWLPSFFTPVREKVGITGAFWVYTGITLAALLTTWIILTPRVEKAAIARAESERKEAGKDPEKPAGKDQETAAAPSAQERTRVPLHMWLALPFIIFVVGAFLASLFGVVIPDPYHIFCSLALLGVIMAGMGLRPVLLKKSLAWLANHPLADAKFFFFIFALIPVQTLFTYNWLILPQYLERAFSGTTVSDNFEVFANLNPILIFFAVPMVTALTQKSRVYLMMILGTLVMAAPAFLLALGTTLPLLMGYLFIMTIGEAMWQPRFLQYAAEIAPEGRTGAYMGVAQFPWYLTKMLVPLYSGFMLQKFVPSEGAQRPEILWLVSAVIAMLSPFLLIVAKGWVGKDFKTKA